jgi:hypothetical protein
MSKVRVPDIDKIVQYIFEWAVENRLPEYQQNASRIFARDVVKTQLRGERTGRLYPRNPNVWWQSRGPGIDLYRASTPDEIPAERTGRFADSWEMATSPVLRVGEKKASTKISSRTRYNVYSKGPRGGAKGVKWNLGILLWRGREANPQSGAMAGRDRYPYDIMNRGKARICAYTSRFKWNMDQPLKETERAYASGSGWTFAKYVDYGGS